MTRLVSNVIFTLILLNLALLKCSVLAQHTKYSGEREFYPEMISSSQADSLENAWPMCYHDSQNTGFSNLFGPQNSYIKWRYYEPEISWSGSSGISVGGDGSVYFGTDNGLYKVNSFGTKKWFFPADDVLISPLIDRVGNIYIVTNDNKLIGVTNDGNQFSSINVETRYSEFGSGNYYVSPVIDQNGIVYYTAPCVFNSQRHPALFAIDMSDETINWIFDLVDTIRYEYPNESINYSPNAEYTERIPGPTSSPSIDENNIYIGIGNRILSINQNGILNYQKYFDVISSLDCNIGNIVISSNGNLLFYVKSTYEWTSTYHSGYGGTLFCFSSKGEKKWEINGRWDRNLIVDQEGNIYIPGSHWGFDHRIGYVDIFDSLGTKIKRIDGRYKQIIGDKNKTIFGRIGTGSVRALNIHTEEVEWSFSEDIAIYSSPSFLAIGNNRTLYIPTYNGVYAVWDFGLLAPENEQLITSNPVFEWTLQSEPLSFELLLAKDNLFSDIIWSKYLDAEQRKVRYNGTTLLLPDSTYYWKMRFQDRNLNWSDWTPAWSFTKVAADSLLSSPALNLPVNESYVLLPEIFSWENVSGSEKYLIQIASNEFFNDTLWQAQSNINRITVPDGISGLINTGSYFWRVSAIDSTGNLGNYSTPFVFTKTSIISPPQIPTLLKPVEGDTITDQTINFTWNPSSNATTFSLCYSIEPDFPQDSDKTWTIQQITSSNYSLTLSAFESFIYWRVKAFNSGGQSEWSAVHSFFFDVESSPELSSIVLDAPDHGATLEQGVFSRAHAYITGTYTGAVSGEWLLDGNDWTSFDVNMISGESCEINSPQLPVEAVGDSHSVQIRIHSPCALYSKTVEYQVGAGDWGEPAALVLKTDPSIILTNGDTSKITATVIDTDNKTVYSYNDDITFTVLSGHATIPANSTVTAVNGSATITLTSSDNEETIEIEASIADNSVANVSETIIATHSEVQKYLDPLEEYVDRLKNLKVELSDWAAVKMDKQYDMTGVEDFINNKIKIPSPEPSDIESLKRLKLAVEAVDHIYYHRLNSSSIDQCAEVLGAQMTVDNTVKSIVQVGTLAFGSLAKIEEIAKGKGFLKKFVRIAARKASQLILNILEDAMDHALNRISNSRIRDTALQTKNFIFFSINAAIDQGEALVDIIADVGLRIPADKLFLEHYVENTQCYIDQAVWNANHPEVAISGKSSSARVEVNLKISEVRATTLEAKLKIDAMQHAADVQDLIGMVALVPGIGTVVSTVSNAIQSGELIWTVGHGFKIYSQIFIPLMKASHLAFKPDGEFSGNSSPVIQNSLARMDFNGPNKALYKQLMRQSDESMKSYEAILREVVSAVETDNHQLVEELTQELIQKDDDFTRALELVQSPIIAASETAHNTVAGFFAAYDSTFVLAQKSASQRAQLYDVLMNYLDDPSDRYIKQQLIDTANLALQMNNSANMYINSVITKLFNVPAHPLILVKNDSLPDLIAIGDIVDMQVTLMNTGAGTAHNVSLSVSADSGFSIITQDSVFLGDMNSGEEKQVNLQIKVLESILPDTSFFGWGKINIMPYSENSFVLTKSILAPIYDMTNSVNQSIFLSAHKLNMISFNTQPLDFGIEIMLDDIESLLVAQDDEGQFCIPAYDIDTIGDVDFSNGYQVYYTSSEAEEIINEGIPLDPTSISQNFTNTKLHMISYPYQQPHQVTDVFSSIADKIVVVQNDKGEFWIPSFDVNTIEDMQPGDGYQIFVNDTVSYTCPNLPENQLAKTGGKVSSLADQSTRKPQHFHFTETGQPYAVVIKSLKVDLNPGDEIGLFAGEKCVGAGVFDGHYPFAIAAWQQVKHKNIDLPGFEKGDDISVKIYNQSVKSVNFKTVENSSAQFGAGPMAVLFLTDIEKAVPKSYCLYPNYPNPFNPETTISYDIPEQCTVRIEIYDINGRKVRVLRNSQQPAGHYTVTWAGRDQQNQPVSSGVYFYRMKTSGFVKTHKMTLMR